MISKIENKRILLILIVALAAILPLIPTISDNFIFDDESLVGNNEMIKEMKYIPDYFKSDILNNVASSERGPLYRPLLLTSLALNYRLFGHSALAGHIINVILHAIASVLFFYILTLYLGFSLNSLLPALLFAVHPVHVDAVAFIINRSELMALLFIFIGFICLKKGYFDDFFSGFNSRTVDKIPKCGICKLSIALLAFLCALFSKETALTVILVLLVFYVIKLINGFNLKDLRYMGILLSGLCFLAIIYFILRNMSVGSVGSDPSTTIFADRNFFQIFPTMNRVFLDYFKLLFLPLTLKVDYSNYEISKSLFDVRALIAYAVHISILALAFLNIRKKPFVSFLIFSFYATLSPVSQIIPFNDIKAERFLYIPSVFFSLAFVFLFMEIPKSNRHYKNITLFVILLVVFYGSLTLKYSSNFISEEILWTTMVERSPENVKMNYNKGLYLWKKHEYEMAVPILEKVVRLNKFYYRAYAPLGVSYSMLGKIEKAQTAFIEGLRIAPDYPLLNQNYAVFNYFKGDIKKAYFHIMKAYEKQPENESVIKIKNEIEKKVKIQNLN